MDVVHHMYDSSGNDSEDEELERERRRKMQELHEQLLYASYIIVHLMVSITSAKEKRRLELWQQKNTFTPGQWNVNTVLMGGLGKDPDEIQEETSSYMSL